MAIFEAGLGTKKKPSVTCRRYWELHPLSADAVDGLAWVLWQALVYAWCGDRSRALEQLARLEKLRASSSPGHLQFSPKWDDLRGDARFEKIVASVAAPLKIE